MHSIYSINFVFTLIVDWCIEDISQIAPVMTLTSNSSFHLIFEGAIDSINPECNHFIEAFGFERNNNQIQFYFEQDLSILYENIILNSDGNQYVFFPKGCTKFTFDATIFFYSKNIPVISLDAYQDSFFRSFFKLPPIEEVYCRSIESIATLLIASSHSSNQENYRTFHERLYPIHGKLWHYSLLQYRNFILTSIPQGHSSSLYALLSTTLRNRPIILLYFRVSLGNHMLSWSQVSHIAASYPEYTVLVLCLDCCAVCDRDASSGGTATCTECIFQKHYARNIPPLSNMLVLDGIDVTVVQLMNLLFAWEKDINIDINRDMDRTRSTRERVSSSSLDHYQRIRYRIPLIITNVNLPMLQYVSVLFDIPLLAFVVRQSRTQDITPRVTLRRDLRLDIYSTASSHLLQIVVLGEGEVMVEVVKHKIDDALLREVGQGQGEGGGQECGHMCGPKDGHKNVATEDDLRYRLESELRKLCEYIVCSIRSNGPESTTSCILPLEDATWTQPMGLDGNERQGSDKTTSTFRRHLKTDMLSRDVFSSRYHNSNGEAEAEGDSVGTHSSSGLNLDTSRAGRVSSDTLHVLLNSKSSYGMVTPCITVILTQYKRSNLVAQLQALYRQSIRFLISSVVVFQNKNFVDITQAIDDFNFTVSYRIPLPHSSNPSSAVLVHRKIPIRHVHNRHDNFKFHGRFIFALNVQTEYTLVMDDDIIPGHRWLEHCLFTMLELRDRAIVGHSGVIVTRKKEVWVSPSQSYPVEVHLSSIYYVGMCSLNISPCQPSICIHTQRHSPF